MQNPSILMLRPGIAGLGTGSLSHKKQLKNSCNNSESIVKHLHISQTKLNSC